MTNGIEEAKTIAKEYGITFDHNGKAIFPNDKDKLGERIMMDYMGLCYQTGVAAYDGTKNDSIRDANGKRAVLRGILKIMKYEPFLKLERINVFNNG